jgi:hypothetical protein
MLSRQKIETGIYDEKSRFLCHDGKWATQNPVFLQENEI